MSIVCLECNQPSTSLNVLKRHLSHVHKLSELQYVEKHGASALVSACERPAKKLVKPVREVKEVTVETTQSLAEAILHMCEDLSVDESVLVFHSARLACSVLAGTRPDTVPDKEVLLSRESLVRANVFGETLPGFTLPGREGVEGQALPLLAKFCVLYTRAHGWFYPECELTVKEALVRVRVSVDKQSSVELKSTGNNEGSKWLKSVFKSYWDVDGGASHAALDERLMTKIASYRLGLSKSKLYHYKLSGGVEVDCTETFDVSLAELRTGLIVNRKCVSFFKPVTAGLVYSLFLDGVEKPRVWDPSCGFGARMLGFAAMFPEGEYVGCEPASQTRRDLITESRAIVNAQLGFSTIVLDTGSEGVEKCLDPESFDFVFTSPPYFDLEKYFDEPGQCWRDYDTLEKWKAGYLTPTFENAFRALKRHHKMVININSDLANVIIDVALSVGFMRREDLDISMKLNKDHFSRAHGLTDTKSEPFLAFEKP